jgi:hypothetical protein
MDICARRAGRSFSRVLAFPSLLCSPPSLPFCLVFVHCDPSNVRLVRSYTRHRKIEHVTMKHRSEGVSEEKKKARRCERCRQQKKKNARKEKQSCAYAHTHTHTHKDKQACTKATLVVVKAQICCNVIEKERRAARETKTRRKGGIHKIKGLSPLPSTTSTYKHTRRRKKCEKKGKRRETA